MRLRELLDESVVKVGLESRDKEECFEELVDLLVRSGRVEDRASALRAVRQREADGTTGIGKGCAVPHGKDGSIKRLCVAMGTSAEGIEFDAVDDKPVHLVFLILARPNDPGPHVQALAEVSRLLTSPHFCQRMLDCTSPRELLEELDSEG